MTSPLEGIIPTTIEVSLERSEPPTPPAPAEPLVLDTRDNHYVPQNERVSHSAAQPPYAQPESFQTQHHEPAPASVAPPAAPPAMVMAPSPTVVEDVLPEKPRQQEYRALARRPPAEPVTSVGYSLAHQSLMEEEMAREEVQPPLEAAPVPAPTAPPEEFQDSQAFSPQPVFSKPRSSITSRHVLAGFGLIVFGVMAAITSLWVSEKFMAQRSQPVATAPAVAQAPVSAPLPAPLPAASEPVATVEEVIPEPVVITSTPPQAVPQVPEATVAPQAKPVPHQPAKKAAEPPKPSVATPAQAAPKKEPARVVQATPPATAPSAQPRAEQPAAPVDRPAASSRGWAVRVERNGVVFYEDGKALLYRVGDALPNGERLVDVDESSTTYATDKGIRQIRSSPLHSR